MEAALSTNPFDQINLRLARIEEAIHSIGTPSQPNSGSKFYSIAEAAEKLNVSSITIYRQVKAKLIPSKRIGQRIMIPGSYLEN